MEVNCDVVKRVIEILEELGDAGPYEQVDAPDDVKDIVKELKTSLAADPVASLMSVLYDKRTEDFVVKYRNRLGDPVINGNGFNDIVVSGPLGLAEGPKGFESQAETFIKWVNGHIVRPYLIETHERRLKIESANRCRSVANYYTLRKSRLTEGSDERSWCIASEQAADKCVVAILGEPGEVVFDRSPVDLFRVTVNGMNEDVSVVGNGFDVVVGGARKYDKVADLFKWINRQIERTRQ